ncbi:virulence-associated E family protein [Burkholderia seminalis]|uniref:virulence-associated E family protein n=1 Tax=Burkholderia seminalis TaxID=488731 RepID=UPI001CF30D95|nr:virulence-associated E family protein [Burkholderia seminalis]MCA8304188.1 virulence-associated E family protein [Burkholderia seminalis]
MSSTQTNQEQLSNNVSISDEYVGENSAAEKGVSDQGVTVFAEPDWTVIPDSWSADLITREEVARDIYDWCYLDFDGKKIAEPTEAEKLKQAAADEAWKRVESELRRDIVLEARRMVLGRVTKESQEQVRAISDGEQAARRNVKAQFKRDLRKRADELRIRELFKFSDKSPVGMTKKEADVATARGEQVVWAPQNTENNLHRFFDSLYVGGRIDEIHYDTARRMLVDELGQRVDDEWPVRELLDAARVANFRGLTSDVLLKALRKWALDYKFNDIAERVKARLENVERDGLDRLETFLIDTFQCADTPDNRVFSKYWCLSLYNRVMNPGCRAPISMALFGPQDAGKSYFQKVVCEELLFNHDAAPVEFDPDRQFRDLFRDIYGISIIASIPEMTNFGKIGVNRMKAFQTGTTDTFDQKFGFSGAWPRQFIIIMDGNRYEGLWRDNDDVDARGESQGERRWFPVFAFEIPDSVGPVRWRADQGLKLPTLDDGAMRLRENLWQLMKECEDFMRMHGDAGYQRSINDATLMVKRFSKREKDRDEGTVRDKSFDEQFPSALYRAVVRGGAIGTVSVDGVGKVRGLRVLAKDIQSAYLDATKTAIPPQRVSKKMKALPCLKGFAGRDAMKVTAFVFNQPEFADLHDGKENQQKFVEVFVKMFVSDTPDTDDAGRGDELDKF